MILDDILAAFGMLAVLYLVVLMVVASVEHLGE